MQTLEIASPDSPTQTLARGTPVALPFTAGWFLKRMALWMLLVGIGVAAACVLYVAASQAETEASARSHHGAKLARAI